MKALVKLAEKYADHTGKPLDETKFRLVASILWRYFCEGVHDRRATIPGNGLQALLEFAFNKHSEGDSGPRCGELIIDNLAEWDSFQHHPQTNACAFRCGQHAGDCAGPGKPVTNPCFKEAYDKTRIEVKKTMARLKAAGASTGDDELHRSGLGCG
jgi:hypothetical protein